MEQLNLFEIDDITSIETYLKNIDKNDYFIGANDKFFAFLETYSVPFVKSDLSCILRRNDDQEFSNYVSLPQKKLAICVGNNKELFVLTHYYALKTGCGMVTTDADNAQKTIEQVIKKYKYCCIITIEKYTPHIQAIISNLESSTIGVIAGRDYWETLYIINKNLSCKGIKIKNTVSVDRTDYNTKMLSHRDGYTYIPFADSSNDKFIEAIGNSTEVMSFMGHGRDELIWLNNGVICSGIVKENNNSPAPNCCSTGKCFIEEIEILPINKVYAMNVFVNACLTGKIGSSCYCNKHNIAQLFLGEYASTYIGTPYLARAFEAITHYYVALMLSGTKMGDICQYLNRFYSNYQVGLKNNFYLFGDPNYFCSSDYTIFESKLSEVCKITEFELNEETPLMAITVEGNLFEDFKKIKKEVVMTNEHKQPIYCNMLWNAQAGKTTLHLFTRGLFEKGKYFLRITDVPANYQWDIEKLYLANDLVNMNIIDAKTGRYIDESLRTSENFYQWLNCNMARIDNIGKVVYSKYQKLQQRALSIHKDVVQVAQSKIHNSGILFEDLYMESGFKEISRTLSNHKCHYCGGHLFNTEVYSAIFNIRRMHCFCLRCGTIATTPQNADLEIFFECEEILMKNKQNEITLHIKNNGSTSCKGVTSIGLKHGKRYNFSYEPNYIQFEVAPNENESVTFEISSSMDNIPNRLCWIVGIVFANNKFYTATKSVFFDE